jgi:23S rRNA (adenine1618-N6)-methyltransferase
MAEPKVKTELHERNKHRNPYDFKALIRNSPSLSGFVIVNKFGAESINFSDPKAVLALNSALLKLYYNIKNWEIPENYLCPPVPGRADYIHYLADLLANDMGKMPTGERITCLDIGIGANAIYPIIGIHEYGWNFVGADIDRDSLLNVEKLITANENLQAKINLRQQLNPRQIFRDIIKPGEYYDVTICNPPFHASANEAQLSSARKKRNLKLEKNAPLNFGGVSNELWYEGGEKAFLLNMAYESKHFGRQVNWFTTLVSKKENLKAFNKALKRLEAVEIKEIQMSTGNKISRVLAWRFYL